MGFKDLLRQIRNGDPVDESTINPPLRDLSDNDRYLLDLINALASSSAVYRRNATVAEAVSPGEPVFFNSATSRFEQGLAAASVIDGVARTADSALLWGICSVKKSSTRADILLQGYAELDISGPVGGAVTAGLYFLSATTPGGLTLQEPPVGVPVLYSDGDGGVFVNGNFSDLFSAHQHYRFNLVCEPCGTPELDAGRYTITGADDSLPGWLPANHASFNGQAPAGAVFGYNIPASSLADSWPPTPLAGAVLEWFNGIGISLPDLEGLAVINNYGIWWMTDCEDWQPWPADFIFGGTTPTFDPLTCPPTPPMSLRLWYARSKFQTADTVVTSLRAKTGSVLTVRCLNDENVDQATGDLEIDADLTLLLDEDTDTAGHVVLKGLVDGKFTRGPVVSGVKTAGGSLLLSSVDGADVDGYHVGNVLLTVLQSPLGLELDVQSIRLFGATEENYLGTLGLGFPVDRQTSYLGEVHVPYSLDVTTISLGLRFWVLARGAGALPPLTLTVQVLTRPSPADDPVALVETWSPVVLELPAAALAEDQYIEVTSAAIETGPGDVLLFSLERDDSAGDGFPGEVHVIRQSAVILGAL